jgi:hypothetical protein
MKYKEDIDIVRKRLYAFWDREIIDRACISVVAPKRPGDPISMFENPEKLQDKPEELRKYWEDPETIYKNNIARLERTFLGGETLPVVFQNYGTSGHCNYFGAVPTYGNDTIWFDHVWKDLSEARTAYTEVRLKKHLEIARYLTENAKDNFYVAMPDHTGTIDSIGHLYGTENMLIAMLEEPELVKEAISIVNEGWIKVNDLFYNISREHNQGGVHAWMHLLAPGRLQHMQCDMSVMFSSDIYGEFVVDELKKQMEWLDYPVYHFDGIEQEKHLIHLLKLEKLKAIQWTYVAGQPSASHYLHILKRIQEAGKSLIIMAPPTDVPILLEHLSARGLYIHTETKTKEEAEYLITYTEKHSKE